MQKKAPPPRPTPRWAVDLPLENTTSPATTDTEPDMADDEPVVEWSGMSFPRRFVRDPDAYFVSPFGSGSSKTPPTIGWRSRDLHSLPSRRTSTLRDYPRRCFQRPEPSQDSTTFFALNPRTNKRRPTSSVSCRIRGTPCEETVQTSREVVKNNQRTLHRPPGFFQLPLESPSTNNKHLISLLSARVINAHAA